MFKDYNLQKFNVVWCFHSGQFLPLIKVANGNENLSSETRTVLDGLHWQEKSKTNLFASVAAYQNT